MRWMVMVAMLLAIVGCNTSVTETGYEPRKLTMGDSQLKGLYAPKYSAEALNAQAEKEKELKARSPGTGLFR